uniref:Uncharacterized protein n=1 Tax=Rhizophora mucronata TaxID=61149 RepID=A0A2P2JS75_RHIMU
MLFPFLTNRIKILWFLRGMGVITRNWFAKLSKVSC